LVAASSGDKSGKNQPLVIKQQQQPAVTQPTASLKTFKGNNQPAAATKQFDKSSNSNWWKKCSNNQPVAVTKTATATNGDNNWQC